MLTKSGDRNETTNEAVALIGRSTEHSCLPQKKATSTSFSGRRVIARDCRSTLQFHTVSWSRTFSLMNAVTKCRRAADIVCTADLRFGLVEAFRNYGLCVKNGEALCSFVANGSTLQEDYNQSPKTTGVNVSRYPLL